MEPKWEFLGVDAPGWMLAAVGVLGGALVSFYFHKRQDRPKTLDWAVKSVVRIQPDSVFNSKFYLAIVPNLESSTTTILENAGIVECRIKNTGERAIRSSDFDQPVRVSAKEGSIVDLAVVGASSAGICEIGSLTPEIEDEIPQVQYVELPRILLNPGDWIDFQVILNNAHDVELTTRIVEQSRDLKRYATSEFFDSKRWLIKQILLNVGFLGLSAIIFAILNRS